MPSIFTRIINGEIPCHKIWEDERVFAFLDIRPIQPGMTLVVPKQEIDNAFHMNDEDFCALLLATKKLIEPIREAAGSVRVGLVIEGLEVPHAHIKLIPINGPGDLDSANAREATHEELAAMAQAIRARISG
ncbi:HIT family protein [Patescibacteria group bacterium]|uniref:HIT family protein n=1 Tax=candidate division WWE3 bacterium TaxID=2053526 RepID=A0A928TX06_UNCKA|nr:HIT family protein [candidate division WWE3 bacterium]MCL4732567.1 HIT family protein [Patescibacteria group bacterium]MDL1953245.1 HIT family protein [Candidatus Uhrbacteria bacterium UHB]RIL00946.1 MAG: HIT family protein [Candidatus Uhrbacteria bacterium]